VHTTPLLKELENYVTPHHAAKWREIGTQLDIGKGTLDAIEHDCYHKAVPCCNSVWEKWLEVDDFASWKKLLDIIQSPAVLGSQVDEKSK